MSDTTRFAVVRNADNAEKLWSYLPGNYAIVAGIDGDYLIAGVDDAGWTLDGYVIPRLASGIIQCVEVTPRDALYVLTGAQVEVTRANGTSTDERPARLIEVYDDALDALHANRR